MIGTSVSHYRIVEKLGAGGMGEVYAAQDQHLGRLVAIKFPSAQNESSEFLRRFQHEARAASRLTHPNIARVYDYGEATGGRPFLVMELVRGTSVRDLLGRGRLDAARTCTIVTGVLRALAEAHAHGLVHRDIKPANVMLEPGGAVKVLDFGLAKTTGPEVDGTHAVDTADAETITGGLTAPGHVPGTPEYMSPEQARGDAIDGRSDLFSTGVLLYRCLTGAGPFAGPGKRDVLERVQTLDPPPPSTIVPELDRAWNRIAARALEKDPARRYQSAAEMLADVQELDTSRTRSQSISQSVADAIAGTRLRRVLTGVVLVALASITVWLVRSSAAHTPPPDAVEWYQRGAIALRDGTYYAATRMLQKAVDLDPRYALAHARLAEAAAELDDGARASQEMLAAVPAGAAMPGGVAGLYISAIYRTLVHDFSGAATVYQQLATTVEGVERAAVLVDLGRVYEKTTDTKKALAAYRDAIARDPSNASAHLRAGMLLGRQRDAAWSSELDRAFELYQALSNTEGQAEVLYQRGYILSPLDAPAARTALEQSRTLARGIPSEQQVIAATLQLGTIAMLSGDAETAEKQATEGIERARAAGMNYFAARGLANRGDALAARQEWPRVEASYRESLEVSRRYDLRRTEARALFYLANLHQTIGPIDAAIQEVAPALAYYRDAGYQIETLQCLLVLGRAHRDLGHGPEAAAAFEQSLAAARKIGDATRVINAQQGLATVYVLYARWPEALTAYEEFRQSAAAQNDADNVVRGFTGRGAVLWRLGRYAEAEQALADAGKAMEKATASAAPVLVSSVRYRRAEMALSQGHGPEAAAMAKAVFEARATNPQLAQTARCLAGVAMARSRQAAAGRALCEPALEALVKSGDRFAIAESRLWLAEIRLAGGDASTALADLDAVIQASDGVKDAETGWRAWALRARVLRQLGQVNDGRDAARRAADVFGSLGWAPEPLQGYGRRPDVVGLQREIGNAGK